MKKKVGKKEKKKIKQEFVWGRVKDSVPFCVKLYEIILTAVLIAVLISTFVVIAVELTEISTWDLFNNVIYFYAPFLVAILLFSYIYNIKNLSEYKLPKILSPFNLEYLVYFCCILLVLISIGFLDEILSFVTSNEAISKGTIVVHIMCNCKLFIRSNLLFCFLFIWISQIINKKISIIEVILIYVVWLPILILSLLIQINVIPRVISSPWSYVLLFLYTFYFCVMILTIRELNSR